MQRRRLLLRGRAGSAWRGSRSREDRDRGAERWTGLGRVRRRGSWDSTTSREERNNWEKFAREKGK
jgi:hypothetical protein